MNAETELPKPPSIPVTALGRKLWNEVPPHAREAAKRHSELKPSQQALRFYQRYKDNPAKFNMSRDIKYVPDPVVTLKGQPVRGLPTIYHYDAPIIRVLQTLPDVPSPRLAVSLPAHINGLPSGSTVKKVNMLADLFGVTFHAWIHDMKLYAFWRVEKTVMYEQIDPTDAIICNP